MLSTYQMQYTLRYYPDWPGLCDREIFTSKAEKQKCEIGFGRPSLRISPTGSIASEDLTLIRTQFSKFNGWYPTLP